MAEDDDIIPLAPLDDESEKKRKAEIKHCLEMQEALLAEQTGEPVVPIEHRSNLTARDMDHHVINYCMDCYNGQKDRLKLHLNKMQANPEMAIQSAKDFLSGKVAEKTLKIMLPEELAEYLQDLIERLQAM